MIPCSNGACVVVSYQDGQILVRDSKLGGQSPIIAYTAEEWTDLVEDLKDEMWPTSWFRIRADVAWVRNKVKLHFTDDEITRFIKGAKAGEFAVEVLTR